MENLERKFASGVEKGFKYLIYGLFALFFIAVFGFVVQYLWNWLMPEIFGLPELTYWKALGLLALSKILFGGFGGNHKKHRQNRRSEWRKRFRQKWENMSEEERAKYRNCWTRAKNDPAKPQVFEEKQNIEENKP